MKKIKNTKRLNLQIDTLRLLQAQKLRNVDGGVSDSAVGGREENQVSAASSGPVCCA